MLSIPIPPGVVLASVGEIRSAPPHRANATIPVAEKRNYIPPTLCAPPPKLEGMQIHVIEYYERENDRGAEIIGSKEGLENRTDRRNIRKPAT